MKQCCYLLFTFLLVQTAICNRLKAQSLSLIADTSVRQEITIDSLNAQALKIYTANPAKARSIVQNCLLLSRQLNYTKGMGESLLYVGKTYWAQSYYPISLFYYSSALPYLQKLPQHFLLADCYRCLGRNYTDLKKYDEALFYLQKAFNAAGNSLQYQQVAFMERSNTYLMLKEYDKSISDIHTSIKICRRTGNDNNIAILYSRLYNIYLEKKQLDSASAYCDTAYLLSIITKNNRLRTISLMSKANLNYLQGKYESAVALAQQSAQLADSIGNIEVFSNASKLLFKIYSKTNDKDKALIYQGKYIQLQDSLNQVYRQNSIQLIEDYFSLNARLHDIDQVAQKNEFNNTLIKSQKLTIYSLSIAVLVLFIVAYVLFKFYRQKNQLSNQLRAKHVEAVEQNKLIEIQSANLNELNQQKDRLLAIIGHDLKSPLANVSSIVDLFGSGEITVDEAQSLMIAMDPVVKGAELTLSSLVEWAGSQVKGNHVNTTTVDLLAVVSEVNDINQSSLAEKDIRMFVEIPVGTYALADENHVKMILRNLVSNAIKFTGEGGVVTVGAEIQDNSGKVLVRVDDTGEGMSADETSSLFLSQIHFSKPGTKGEKGTGIGLQLCRQLVELNGGKIGVNSIPGKGSSFYFTLLSSDYTD